MVLILSYYQVHKARLLRSGNVLIPRAITRRIATKPYQKKRPQNLLARVLNPIYVRLVLICQGMRRLVIRMNVLIGPSDDYLKSFQGHVHAGS